MEFRSGWEKKKPKTVTVSGKMVSGVESGVKLHAPLPTHRRVPKR
jgi:hypothetical protein